MSEEFVPTSLDVIMGEVDDTPPVIETKVEVEPEKVEEEAAPEEEVPKEEPEPKEDQASNFAELRSVIKEIKQENTELKAKQEPEKVPDIFEDQAGYTAHLEKKFSNSLLNMSEDMVKEQFDDYDTMLDRVVKEAETNPAIRANLQHKPNVALAVYKEGKRLTALDLIGDPVKFEANLRARILEENKAGAGADEETAAKEKAELKKALPDDLTSESNAGSRTEKEVFKPTTMDTLFPD